MKDLISCIIIASFLINACSKDSLPKELQRGANTYVMDLPPSDKGYYKNEELSQQHVPYQLIDGRIVLQNSEDFKLFMWGLEDQELQAWEESIQHLSYLRSHPALEGNFSNDCKELAAALNQDGLIQIEPYLFKLDPLKEKVYVLESKNIDLLPELLHTNSSTVLIKEFTFQEDIWSLLENLHPDSEGKIPALKCKDKKALNAKNKTIAPACSGTLYWWHQTTTGIRYNRFGIWETCRAFIYNNSYNVYAQSNNHYTDIHITGGIIDYHFEEWCGKVFNGTFTIPNQTTDKYSVLLRSNKTPLARGKSTVDMEILFNYLCGPKDPYIYHDVTLSNF